MTFGDILLPQSAWNCANGLHSVTSWETTTEAACTEAGAKTGACDYCGEIVNETIAATGHTATTYSDGNLYAVYKIIEQGSEDYKWCALCETCDEWFEIEESDIYDFVLVAKDEASLDAALDLAKERTDGSDANRTKILVSGEIKISDTSYVKIDCDNVEIYGLGSESSKIIESAYETSENSGKAQDGVEISGKNVTIRDLTIDGSKLNENSEHAGYEHGLEILGGAENVTLSGCVIIGGTSNGSSAVVLMGDNVSGNVLIENCILSGYRGIMIERNGGDALYVTISGGSINGAYYGIHTEGLGAGDNDGVYLNVEGATINGKNSLGAGASFTFTNCTFGFGVYNNVAYGSVNTYCDVTLTDCTFSSNDTEVTSSTDDPLVNNSNNYVIQARTENITIVLIDCQFVNTYTSIDLEIGTLDVNENTFLYLVGSKSSVKNCYLYFDDPETSLKYFYNATNHTVTAYVSEKPDDDNP